MSVRVSSHRVVSKPSHAPSRSHAQAELKRLLGARTGHRIVFKADPFRGVPANRVFSVSGHRVAVLSDMIVARGSVGYLSYGRPSAALKAALAGA